MPAVGHPPNISMLPILVNRYAIRTVPALDFSFCDMLLLEDYFMA